MIKQANSLCLALNRFKQEFKLFGSEFLYEETDLFTAFDKIGKVIRQHSLNEADCKRMIKAQLIFTSDILRESCETVQVNKLFPETVHEEEEQKTSSLFDDIEIVDCDRTILAVSELGDGDSQKGAVMFGGKRHIGSVADFESEGNPLMYVSIEHSIAFNIKDSIETIQPEMGLRDLIASDRDDIKFADNRIIKIGAAPTESRNKAAAVNKTNESKLLNPMQSLDDLDLESIISTEMDQCVESPFDGQKAAASTIQLRFENSESTCQEDKAESQSQLLKRRGTLVVSKLLLPSHFLELENQTEDEVLSQLTTNRINDDSPQVLMAQDDAADDF